MILLYPKDEWYPHDCAKKISLLAENNKKRLTKL